MALTRENTVVGFIGTGVMGKSMAGHLLTAGYPLHVHNRTQSKAEALMAKGAVWHSDIASLVRECGVIITMLGFPKDVEEVYLGGAGILANVRNGSCLIDMTTTRPDLAKRIYDTAAGKQCSALDAPVSGGDIGARNAALSIMVGGDRDAFDSMMPLFQLMGKTVVHQGKAGSGQHCKMCNQIAIACGMMGVCEALAYAGKAGLDPKTVLQSISSGAAGSWSLSNLAPRIIDGDFQPGFYVKHFIKDLIIASEAAEKMGLEVPGLNLAKSMYERLAAAGGGDDGTQALFKVYRDPRG